MAAGDEGRDHEHDDHRVRELLDEQAPGRLATSLQELVRTHASQTLLRLGRAQTCREIRAQRLGHDSRFDHPRADQAEWRPLRRCRHVAALHTALTSTA